MSKKKLAESFIIVGALALSSCAQMNSSSTFSGNISEPVEVDVFSARGFLGGSDYERYHLKGNVLWRECGNVNVGSVSKPTKEIAGDSVLEKDPNLNIEERRVETLSREQLNAIKSRAARLRHTLSTTPAAEPPPGSVFTLTDPGLFEMEVQIGSDKNRLVTSVDALTDQTSPNLKDAHSLFSTLRGVGPVICGSNTFFGIPRGKL